MEPARLEPLGVRDVANEALWLGLRTTDGVDRGAFADRFGEDPLEAAERRHAAEAARRAGWLQIDPARLQLTPAGALVADEVASRLWL